MSECDLAELLCARLCHDLINPVSAVGNGMELLGMAVPDGFEDMDMLNDSARAALAALTFFRLAFGPSEREGEAYASAKLARIASDHLVRNRLELTLPQTGPDLPRPAAQLVLVMLLAGVSAAPYGGTVALAPPLLEPLTLVVTVSGDRVGFATDAIGRLCDPSTPVTGAPRDVHLALLPRLAARHGARVHVVAGDGHLAISVTA